MDYYSAKNKTPHDPVAWRPIEQEFTHPWSIEEQCKHYAYHQLKDVMSLDDYLTKPNCVVEDMLVGLIKGVKLREEELANRDDTDGVSKEERENQKMFKETQKIMNQLG